jgi:hypothetical protein
VMSMASTSTEEEEEGVALLTPTGRVQRVLELARALGPVGVRRPERDRDRLLEAALALAPDSDPAPARIALTGVHSLVYSAAPGGSSGRIGPLNGAVTQEFDRDGATFINAVQVLGLRIALTATRRIQNDTTIAVKFHRTAVSVFGVPIVERETRGGGAWKVIYAGTITDRDGTTKLVRILQTPSLFVIEQPLAATEAL